MEPLRLDDLPEQALLLVDSAPIICTVCRRPTRHLSGKSDTIGQASDTNRSPLPHGVRNSIDRMMMPLDQAVSD